MEIRGVLIDGTEQIGSERSCSGPIIFCSVAFADGDRLLGVPSLECDRRNNKCQVGARTSDLLISESLSEQRNTARIGTLLVRDGVVNADKTSQDQAVAAGNPRKIDQVRLVDERIVLRWVRVDASLRRYLCPPASPRCHRSAAEWCYLAGCLASPAGWYRSRGF